MAQMTNGISHITTGIFAPNSVKILIRTLSGPDWDYLVGAERLKLDALAGSEREKWGLPEPYRLKRFPQRDSGQTYRCPREMHHNNVLETLSKESTLIYEHSLVIFWFHGGLLLISLYYLSSNWGPFKSLRDRDIKYIVIRPGEQAQLRNILGKPGVLYSPPTSQHSLSFIIATSSPAVLAVLLTHPQWDWPTPLFNSDGHTAGSLSWDSPARVHTCFFLSLYPPSQLAITQLPPSRRAD